MTCTTYKWWQNNTHMHQINISSTPLHCAYKILSNVGERA